MTFDSDLVFVSTDNNSYALCFAGNEIAVRVTMANNEFPTGASATKVTATIEIDGRRYPYSSEVTNNGTAEFNVATAWGAAYGSDDTEIDSTGYTVKKGTIKVQTSYIPSGELTVASGAEVTAYENVFVLRGGVTDMEIFKKGYAYNSDAVNAYASSLTRKPNIKQIVNVGDVVFSSALDLSHIDDVIDGTAELRVNTTRVTVSKNSVIANAEIEERKQRKEIVFINSFGVLEGFSCNMLEELSHKIKLTSYNITKGLGYGTLAKSHNTASARKNAWKMSSGYLSAELACWFVDEVLTARRHWLKLDDGKMLPVSISTESESINIYDRTKASLNDIQFVVTSTIEGITL